MELSAYKDLFLILFIVLVVAMNVWLFTSLKNKNLDSSLHILKKSADTIRDPFKKENKDIEELSLLLKKINNETKNKENL